MSSAASFAPISPHDDDHDVISEAVPLVSESSRGLKDVEELSPSDEEELIDEIEEEVLSTRALSIVFASLYFGIFLSALDGTIVATLLAHIASEFDELRSVSWIATGYMIAVAALQPIYGKISDIYGRKPLLLISNSLFGIGSILCGVAPSMKFLIFARVIAGAGGAGLWSLSSITLSDIVPLRTRGILQGIGSALYGSGAALGGVVGGAMADSFGWRWAFLAQGPIIFLSVLAIQFNLNLKKKEVDERNKLGRIDFAGAGFLVLTLFLFLFATSVGGNYAPWSSLIVVGSLLASFVMAGVFVYVELRVAAEPIITLQLLKNRNVLFSSLTAMLMNVIYYAHVYYTPLFLITVRGESPTNSGSVLIPEFVGSGTGAVVAGYYMRRTGRYGPVNLLGLGVMVIGAIPFVFVGYTTTNLQLMVPLLISGFGIGIMFTGVLVALVAAVSRDDQAIATSIQSAFKGIGSTLGISIASSVYQNVMGGKLEERITVPNAAEIIVRIKDSVEYAKTLSPDLQAIVVDCYLIGVRAVYIAAVGFTVLCFICGASMKEHVLHSTMRH